MKRPVTLNATPWDLGPVTSAAQAGTVVETLPEPNPNRVQRRRRICVLEAMHSKGALTLAQYNAGKALQAAWEACHRSPDKLHKVRVDVSGNPDAPVTMHVERTGRLAKLTRNIPRTSLPVVEHVIYGNRHINAMHGNPKGGTARAHLRRLHEALDALHGKC